MEDYSAACEKIRQELVADFPDVRERFLAEFQDAVERFVHLMAEAFLAWRALDKNIGQDIRSGHVSGLVYSAVTLHILSMRLLLSGHVVAAGNLMRQVIESMASALLCSVAELGILDEYIKGDYRANKSIRQLLKHAGQVGVPIEAVEDLRSAQLFYHQYSHPSLLTVASHICSETEGALYVGCSFDAGKIDAYEKEIDGRLGLAGVLLGFVHCVARNLKAEPGN
ncbi:MAG: hypothetical protein ACYDA8_12945 [Deferrisomatales bacterium]